MPAPSGPAPLPRTPLVRLGHVSRVLGADVYLKVETCNPYGEARLRAMDACVRAALTRGDIRPSGFIVDAADASLGIPMAMAACRHDLRLMLCVPADTSPDDLEALEELGAKTLIAPAGGGMDAAMALAAREHWDSWRSWRLDPFANPDAARAWHDLAGAEIAEDAAAMGVSVDAVVACVGTGACLTGLAARLREDNPALRVVAVEPAESAVLSGGTAGPHRLRGAGYGLIPQVLDMSLVDRVLPVACDDAEAAARRVFAMEGLPAGIATGATVRAIMDIAREPGMRGGTIVGVMTDDRRTLRPAQIPAA